jgi:hypothetical protein
MGNGGALYCMSVTAPKSHAEMSPLKADACRNTAPPRLTHTNHHARTRAPNSHHTTTDSPPPPSQTSTVVGTLPTTPPHTANREKEPMRAPHMHAGVSQYGQRGRTKLHVGHGADIPRRDVAVECQCSFKHCTAETNPNQPSCPHTRAKQPSHHHQYPIATLAHSDIVGTLPTTPSLIATREIEPMRAPHTHAHVRQYGQRGRTTTHAGHGADIPRRYVAVESRCLIKHCATKANPHQPSCPHARQTAITPPPIFYRHPRTLRSSSAHCRPPHRTNPLEREPMRAPHTRAGIGQYGQRGALYFMSVTALTSHAEISPLKADACRNTAPPRPTQTNRHAYTRAPNSHHTTTDIPPPPSHTPIIVGTLPTTPSHTASREREPMRAPHTRAGIGQYGQRGRTTLHVGHGADIPRRDVAVESRCLPKHCATKANPHQPSCPHTCAKQPSHHHRYPTTTLAHSDHRRHIADHPITHSHSRDRAHASSTHACGYRSIWATGAHYSACWSRR